MFDNIGGKIKKLTQVICWIGMITSVLVGFVIMSRPYGGIAGVIIGVIVAAAGCFVSWIGSFFLYGFGQLIENSDILVSRDSTTSNKSALESSKNDEKKATLDSWKKSGLITEEDYEKKMEKLE